MQSSGSNLLISVLLTVDLYITPLPVNITIQIKTKIIVQYIKQNNSNIQSKSANVKQFSYFARPTQIHRPYYYCKVSEFLLNESK